MFEAFEDYDKLVDTDGWWKYCTPPFKEQIEIANKIAQVLNINFPVCSNQYTRATYAWFIKSHIEDYNKNLHDWLETNDFIDVVDFLS